jgi:signal peptidase I
MSDSPNPLEQTTETAPSPEAAAAPQAPSAAVNTPREIIRRRPLWRKILRGIEHALALIGFLSLVYHGGFNLSQVQSPSMSPTLEGTSRVNGDHVLTEKITYRFRRPKRWEVIAFHTDELGQVMKRVVGLPGEKVQVTRNGSLLINGLPQEPPPGVPKVRYLAIANVYYDRVYQCGRGYYVLGDDTQDSEDSRYIGEILPEDIIGRPWIIWAPASRRGFVNP